MTAFRKRKNYLFLFTKRSKLFKIPALHDCEQQLGSVVLQLQDEVHSCLAQGVDVVQDKGGDDAQPVGLVGGDASLILVTRTL